MVKGISKRVVIVRAPDTKLFDEAIFILRDGVEGPGRGVGQEEILSEARRVAQLYVSRNTRPKKKRGISLVPGVIFAAAGAGAVGLLWLISSFIQ